MHSQFGRIIAIAVAAAGLSFGADHGLLNLVGPDVQFIAGLQVDQAKGSPLGQYLLKQLPGNDANVDKFIQEAGFDPRKDLREFIVASNSSSRAGLAIVRGTFDIAKISTLAQKQQAQISRYQGYDLIQGKDGNVVAFAENTIAIMGQSEMVK